MAPEEHRRTLTMGHRPASTWPAVQKAIHVSLGSLTLMGLWLAACITPLSPLVPAYVTVLSTIAAIMVAVDKRRASRQLFRLSEASLHLAELLGGWPGALIAQVIFRHKNRKLSFLMVTWTIIALHGLLGYVLW